MSKNYRKNVDVYSQNYMPERDRATWKVYRPNSMRRVSAVKELNRLKAQLDTVRKEGICLWNWAHNWDSPFIEDEHWRVTDAPRIYAALNGEGK